MPSQAGQRRQPNSRFWCFTFNNPHRSEREKLFDDHHDVLTYAVHQYEKAPTTGTKHCQGYVILKKHQNRTWLIRHLFQAFWDIARGSAEQNTVYCSKDDSRLDGPWTYGEIPKSEQGKRSDLLQIQQELEDDIPMRLVAQNHFSSWIRYHKSFSAYIAIIAPPRNFKTQVIVMIGKTGIGKTWWAQNYLRDPHVVFSGHWFDGYKGKGDLVINDFTGQIPFQNLLQIMDNGQWTLESKGGTIQCAPRRLVLTSNYHYDEWYDYVKIKGNIEALERRIDYLYNVPDEPAKVHYFTKEWTDKAAIADPYPAPEVDWDAILEMDDEAEEVTESQAELESTWDVTDEAHGGAHSWDRESAKRLKTVDLTYSDDCENDYGPGYY